jgi:hypothetical protein
MWRGADLFAVRSATSAPNSLIQEFTMPPRSETAVTAAAEVDRSAVSERGPREPGSRRPT